MKAFSILASLTVVMAAGCSASLTQLRARAAFDFSCPENQLSIVNIDGRTKGVTGCGKKAAFVENCTTKPWVGPECTWVLNGGASDNGSCCSQPRRSVENPSDSLYPAQRP